MCTLTLGEKLRRARIDKGLPIAELATQTRISAKFLEALESDRRDLLPAGFFYRNWAVQYAGALSLDRAEVEADVDRILSTEPPLPLPGQGLYDSRAGFRLHQNVHRGRGGAPLVASLSVLFLVVMGCSGFYSWWHTKTQSSYPTAMTAVRPPSSFVADVRSAYHAEPVQPVPKTTLAQTPIAKDTALGSVKEDKRVVRSRLTKTRSSHTSKRMRPKRSRRANRHPLKPETQVATNAF